MECSVLKQIFPLSVLFNNNNNNSNNNNKKTKQSKMSLNSYKSFTNTSSECSTTSSTSTASSFASCYSRQHLLPATCRQSTSKQQHHNNHNYNNNHHHQQQYDHHNYTVQDKDDNDGGSGSGSGCGGVGVSNCSGDAGGLGGMIVDFDNVDAIIDYVIKMQYICSEYSLFLLYLSSYIHLLKLCFSHNSNAKTMYTHIYI